MATCSSQMLELRNTNNNCRQSGRTNYWLEFDPVQPGFRYRKDRFRFLFTKMERTSMSGFLLFLDNFEPLKSHPMFSRTTRPGRAMARTWEAHQTPCMDCRIAHLPADGLERLDGRFRAILKEQVRRRSDGRRRTTHRWYKGGSGKREMNDEARDTWRRTIVFVETIRSLVFVRVGSSPPNSIL